MVAPNAKNLLEAALQLSPEDREALADQLWSSLEGDSDEEQLAWERELDRRIDSLERGDGKLIDGEPILKALKEGRIP